MDIRDRIWIAYLFFVAGICSAVMGYAVYQNKAFEAAFLMLMACLIMICGFYSFQED